MNSLAMSIEGRPKTATAEMKEAAAAAIILQLIDDGLLEEGQYDQSVCDLAKMSTRYDGYEIAKELDRWHGWNCDREMLDYFDNYSSEVRTMVDVVQYHWIKRHNIQPPFPIGATVTYRDGKTGVITDITEHFPGAYSIAEDGDPLARSPQQRRHIVHFEDVAPGKGT